jgi:hypothetical protein
MPEFHEPFELQRKARHQALRDANSKLELADEQTVAWPEIGKEIDTTLIPTLQNWIIQLANAMRQPASLGMLHSELRRLQMMRGVTWRDPGALGFRSRILTLRLHIVLAWLYTKRRIIAEAILAMLFLILVVITIVLLVRFLPTLLEELQRVIRS